MIKLFLLMMFFLAAPYSPKADEVRPDVPSGRDLANLEDWRTPGGDDQEFISALDNIKNPFEDGLGKPVVPINQPRPTYYRKPRTIILPRPESKPVAEPQVNLPALKLQGVMVGEDMHEAIIDGRVVPLLGTIKGARVVSVTKQGVELFFRGKKFFLKVD